MNKVNLLIIICVVMLVGCKKQAINQSETNYSQQRPSTLDPGQNKKYTQQTPTQGQSKMFGLIKKKPKVSYGDQLIEEYEDRMKANVKAKRKKAKEMEKPQYSDWTYFGHKRKPKKRPPEKMKYCEECGIRH